MGKLIFARPLSRALPIGHNQPLARPVETHRDQTSWHRSPVQVFPCLQIALVSEAENLWPSVRVAKQRRIKCQSTVLHSCCSQVPEVVAENVESAANQHGGVRPDGARRAGRQQRAADVGETEPPLRRGFSLDRWRTVLHFEAYDEQTLEAGWCWFRSADKASISTIRPASRSATVCYRRDW